VPGEAPLVGAVGNINPSKGYEWLLRAVAAARQELPDLRLRVLGAHSPVHSAYERGLRDEARRLDLEERDRLRFVDPGLRVPELMPALDVFAISSVPRSEGIPTVILEAMACALPVVATDVGAIREVVEQGVTGFLAPPEDPRALAGAILRLCTDAALRARMGEEARHRVLERYDLERCADAHFGAYQTALAHRRSRRRRLKPGLA
jgi:glycosyltransferase involved in cell wall biosynthesis